MAIKIDGKALSARAQAKKVREWTGWTPQEYKRQYNILRNRVVNYERATGAAAGSINVADLLARNARGQYYARTVYKTKYTPTELWRAVQQAPASSTARATSAVGYIRAMRAGYDRVERQFKGVIQNSKYAEIIRAEVQAAGGLGAITPQEYLAIVEHYARQLGIEREQIRKINAATENPEDIIFFNS